MTAIQPQRSPLVGRFRMHIAYVVFRHDQLLDVPHRRWDLTHTNGQLAIIDVVASLRGHRATCPTAMIDKIAQQTTGSTSSTAARLLIEGTKVVVAADLLCIEDGALAREPFIA